jgi:hypothetical protein
MATRVRVSIYYQSQEYLITQEAAAECGRFKDGKFIQYVDSGAPITSSGLREFADSTVGTYDISSRPALPLVEGFAVARYFEAPIRTALFAAELARRDNILTELFGPSVEVDRNIISRAVAYTNATIPAALFSAESRPETNEYFD